MASGVKVDNACKTIFQEIKMDKKFRYILFGFTPDDVTQIVVLKQADPSATFDEFVADLYSAEQNKECRYGLFDFVYEGGAGMEKNKLLFFMWSPDTASIKQKMLYSSSQDALKKAFGTGIAKSIQANDHGDLQYSSVLEIAKKTDRD